MPDLSSAQTKYLSRLKREKYFVNISRLVLFAGFLMAILVLCIIAMGLYSILNLIEKRYTKQR